MDDNPAAEGPRGRKPNKLTAVAIRVAHNPAQLRVILMLATFAAWYSLVSGPLTAGIDETTARTGREKKRLSLARDVERHRSEVDRFKDRLPRNTDPNEWLQYMLAGTRGSPLRLAMINTESVKNVGPYKAAVIRIEVEGTFPEIDGFLRWVESNPRLFRVDLIHIGAGRDPRKLVASLTLLGVMG